RSIPYFPTRRSSDLANAKYSFPAKFNISSLVKRKWDYGITNQETSISPKDVVLTGEPIFLEIVLGGGKTGAEEISSDVNSFPNPDRKSTRLNSSHVK